MAARKADPPQERAEERSGVTVAVCIGVSQYSDAAIAPLPGASREAADIANALIAKRGCALDQARVEAIGQAGSPTAGEIVDALKRAAARAEAEDVLFVYFSGHAYRDDAGKGDIYLCGRNTLRTSLSDTGIAAAAFARALEPCRAKGVLVVLDCCVSAGFAEEAPLFFRQAGRSEFRVVLAASRSNEPSWELPDGQGTLFSKQLIEVLAGRTPVGATPGHITLAGLVDAIDFGLNEDLRVLHPDVPPQRPLVAGSYGKDPLLFVHRGNQSAGLSVESGRISRGLHRRTIRNVLAGLATAVVFVAMSYLTVVDRTRYAQAIDGNIVRVYQGHPDLGAPGYPRPVAEYELAAAALKVDSPLRNGQPIVAPPGRSIDELIDAQLNDIGTIGRLIARGRQTEARSMLLALLDGPALDPERTHYVRVMFPLVATSADLPRLVDLTNAARPEVRTMAAVGLLRVAPSEAFAILTDALGNNERFDQRAIIQHIGASCPDGGAAYFAAAAGAALFNGIYPTLADAAARTGCRLDAKAIAGLMEYWPTYQLGDLARYADLFAIPRPKFQDLSDPERYTDLALFAADQVDYNCMLPVVRMLSDARASTFAHGRLSLLLSSSGCRAQLIIAATFDASKGLLNIEAIESGDPRKILVSISTDASSEMPPSLFDRLADWIRSGPEPGTAENIEAFLKASASSDGNASFRAMAVDALRKAGRPMLPSADMLTSGTLALRHAAYESLSELDPRQARESLLARVNDGDLDDWPDVVALAPISDQDLPELRRLSTLGSPARERAAAALVTYGSPEDLLELARRPEIAFRRAIADYLAVRGDLVTLAHPAASEAANTDEAGTVMDDLPRLVSAARAEQAGLRLELDAAPASLRAWRARQMIEARRNAFDAGFQRVLSPGARAWLERFARDLERGDASQTVVSGKGIR